MGFWSDLFSWFRRRRPEPPPPRPRPDEPPDPPPPGDADELNQKLLTLHNQERAIKRLPALKLASDLMQRAQMAAQAQWNRKRVGHFTSLSPDRAENAAAGQRTEEEVIESWMSSRGHRQNILGPYSVAGFGRVGDYWAARFA